MNKKIDLTGQRYGEYTVLAEAPSDRGGNAKWLCRCSCGKTAYVRGSDLTSGKVTCCNHRTHAMLNNTIRIDAEDFKRQLDDTGRSLGKANSALGWSYNLLSKRLQSGRMTPDAIKEIEEKFGIVVKTLNDEEFVPNDQEYDSKNTENSKEIDFFLQLIRTMTFTMVGFHNHYEKGRKLCVNFSDQSQEPVC